MQPLISIIIPTFNRAHLLGETLDSIISQTYKNWECLIVDDRSGDYTRELIEFYQKLDARIIYYPQPKNRKKGANACRNYGFEMCNGEYINWFDDDDLMHPKKLEIQVKALQNSDYNFSVCQSNVFDDKTGEKLGLRHDKIWSHSPFEDYLKMKIMWLTQPPLWRKSFILKMRYIFDEDLTAGQEWEFHCRALNFSPTYHYTNAPLVFLRKHNKSITYCENENERFWNYFLARLKIYKNKKLQLTRNSKIYLRSYLLNTFKKMIRSRNPYVFNAFIQFIIPENTMTYSSKFYAFLSIISYTLVGKGNHIHQKIRF